MSHFSADQSFSETGRACVSKKVAARARGRKSLEQILGDDGGMGGSRAQGDGDSDAKDVTRSRDKFFA